MAAQKQFEKDQAAARKAAQRREAEERRFREMQRERNRAEQESLRRVADSVSQLDSDGQELIAAGLAAAMGGIVVVGTLSGNVDYIQISSAFTLSATAFGNGLLLLGLQDAETRDCDLMGCTLGNDPIYGSLFSLSLATGVALPVVASEDIRSTQALEGGLYPGVVSSLTARIFPVRISIEAARFGGSFTAVQGDEPKRSVAWGLSGGIGLQLFGGGLFSPWGEVRFSTMPNCRDEGWMTQGDVLECSGADVYKVGNGGGAYEVSWVIGNTFSLRSLFASGGAGPSKRTSTFLDVSYQVSALSGSGVRVMFGSEYCVGCE